MSRKKRKHLASAEINNATEAPQSILINDLINNKPKQNHIDYHWIECGSTGKRFSVKESEKVRVAIEMILKFKYYSSYPTSRLGLTLELKL